MPWLSPSVAKRILCGLAACLLLPAIWTEIQGGSLIGAAAAGLIFGCFSCGVFVADPAATFYAKSHAWFGVIGEAVFAFLSYKMLYVALDELRDQHLADFIADMALALLFLSGVFWRHLTVRGMFRRVQRAANR